MISLLATKQLWNWASEAYKWASEDGAIVLAPIVTAIAVRSFFPFATVPLIIKGAGTWAGQRFFRGWASSNPLKTHRIEKKLDFLRKYVYIIYVASLVAEVATAYLCLPLAIGLALTTALAIGCIVEGTLTTGRSEKSDSSSIKVAY